MIPLLGLDPKKIVDDLFQRLDQLNERQTALSAQLTQVLAHARWRETSHRWVLHDGTATGAKKYETRKLLGVSAMSLQIVRINGATGTIRVNGEEGTYDLSNSLILADEAIEQFEINVTGAGTGTIDVRLGAYTGPGA